MLPRQLGPVAITFVLPTNFFTYSIFLPIFTTNWTQSYTRASFQLRIMAGQDRVCGPCRHPTLDGCPNTTPPSSRKAPEPRAGNRLPELKSGITRGQLGVGGNKVGQAWEKPAGPRLYRTKRGDGGLNKDGSGHQQLPERLNRKKKAKLGSLEKGLLHGPVFQHFRHCPLVLRRLCAGLAPAQ